MDVTGHDFGCFNIFVFLFENDVHLLLGIFVVVVVRVLESRVWLLAVGLFMLPR